MTASLPYDLEAFQRKNLYHFLARNQRQFHASHLYFLDTYKLIRNYALFLKTHFYYFFYVLHDLFYRITLSIAALEIWNFSYVRAIFVFFYQNCKYLFFHINHLSLYTQNAI